MKLVTEDASSGELSEYKQHEQTDDLLFFLSWFIVHPIIPTLEIKDWSQDHGFIHSQGPSHHAWPTNL